MLEFQHLKQMLAIICIFDRIIGEVTGEVVGKVIGKVKEETYAITNKHC